VVLKISQTFSIKDPHNPEIDVGSASFQIAEAKKAFDEAYQKLSAAIEQHQQSYLLQVVSATNYVQQLRDKIKIIYGNEEIASKKRITYRNDQGQTLIKNGYHKNSHKGRCKNQRRPYGNIKNQIVVDENNSWDSKDPSKNSRKLNLSEWPSLTPVPEPKNGWCGPRAVEGENTSDNSETNFSKNKASKNENNSSENPELPKFGNPLGWNCIGSKVEVFVSQTTKKNHKQPSGYATQN